MRSRQIRVWPLRITSAAVLMAALALPVTGAAAVGTADQTVPVPNSLGYSGLTATQGLGQSFTAGLAGVLDQVTVHLQRINNPGDITVQVFAASSGLPVGSALSSTTISQSSVLLTFSDVTATFASPAALTAGSQYFLRLSAPGAVMDMQTYTSNSYRWHNGGNVLANEDGVAFVGSTSQLSSDLVFTTYVSPAPIPSSTPEPTSSPESSAPAAVRAQADALAETGTATSWLAPVGVGLVLTAMSLVALVRRDRAASH